MSGIAYLWIPAHISSQNADAEADHTRTPRSRPRRHIRRSLPSTSSIMAVLYPPSCLGTPPAFPGPPSYLPGDAHPSAAHEDHRERVEWAPLISSTATTGGTLVSSNRHDPLVEAPSLTGIPASGVPPGSAPSTELNVPAVGLGIDALGETEPPPAYSPFDESRSRLPVALDVLGPYPRISAFYPPAR